jgi:hypothetical protein
MLYRATNMTRNKSKKVKLPGYVRVNWGAPFIIAFIILLFSAALSLSIGFSFSAETLARGSFYALVIGVILQLLSLKIKKYEQTGVA